MSNESQDKKDTVPDVPSAKSYPTEGVSTDFDPGALQVQAMSAELRQQMSGTEVPQLDPEYLQDAGSRNPNDVVLPASTPAATTQPSLRRLHRAMQPEAARRGRGVQVLLVLLGVAIVWEVAMLVRTSLGARESGFTLHGQPGPSSSVQISGARPNTDEPSEPSKPSEPAAEPPAPTPPERPAEASPPPKPTVEATAAARNASAQTSAPRSPAPLQDLEPSVHQEPNVRPKQDGAAGPQPASSAKSPSKVLFPPQ